jgi:prophage tail gpP-like protein
MESLSDAFGIVSNNRWIGDAVPIKAGDACRILDGEGNALLTGYIDSIDLAVGENITIRGRDKAGDLIDCTVDGSGEFAGLTLKEIITRIASPFGIKVLGEEGTKITRFRYGLNEPAVDIIRELVTRQGFLCNSNSDGDLVIERAGSTKAAFVLLEGNNIIKGKGVVSAMRRRSSYTTTGQSSVSNTVASTFEGKSTRYRPLATINSGDIEIQDAQTSSEWMGRIADGSSTEFQITVADIQSINPNTLIECESISLGIHGTMLIKGVTKTVNREGSTTSLSIVDPYTFGLDYVGNDFLP